MIAEVLFYFVLFLLSSVFAYYCIMQKWLSALSFMLFMIIYPSYVDLPIKFISINLIRLSSGQLILFYLLFSFVNKKKNHGKKERFDNRSNLYFSLFAFFFLIFTFFFSIGKSPLQQCVRFLLEWVAIYFISFSIFRNNGCKINFKLINNGILIILVIAYLEYFSQRDLFSIAPSHFIDYLGQDLRNNSKRIIAVFTQPVETSIFYSTFLPIILFKTNNYNSFTRYVVIALYVGFGIMTLTRTSIILTILSFTIFAYIKKSRIRLWPAILLFLSFLVIAFSLKYSLFFYLKEYYDSLLLLFHPTQRLNPSFNQELASSTLARLYLLDIFDYIIGTRYFYLGIGFDSFNSLSKYVLSFDIPFLARIFIEGGIIVFLFFFLFIYKMYKKAIHWIIYRRDTDLLVVVLSTINFFIASFAAAFLSFAIYLMILLAYINAYNLRAGNDSNSNCSWNRRETY